MPDFKNRFPQLAKWEDRIADADYYGDFDPVRFREDPDLMKYDIFLAPGWTWEYTGNWQDCHATETFRTLADAKRALREAVKMDPEKEPCKGCPRFKDCHPDAAKKKEAEAKASKPAPVPQQEAPRVYASAEQLRIYDSFLEFDGIPELGSDSEDFAELMSIGEDGKTGATVEDLTSDISWRLEQRENERAQIKDWGDWDEMNEKKFKAFKREAKKAIAAIEAAPAEAPAPAPEERKGNSPKITTVFDPATVEALNARAKADGVKVSDLIRRLVADGLGLKDGGAMRAAHRPRKAR